MVFVESTHNFCWACQLPHELPRSHGNSSDFLVISSPFQSKTRRLGTRSSWQTQRSRHWIRTFLWGFWPTKVKNTSDVKWYICGMYLINPKYIYNIIHEYLYPRVSHSLSLFEVHFAETMVLTIKTYVFQLFPHTNCSATLSGTMDHFIIYIGDKTAAYWANMKVSGKHFLSLDIYSWTSRSSTKEMSHWLQSQSCLYQASESKDFLCRARTRSKGIPSGNLT